VGSEWVVDFLHYQSFDFGYCCKVQVRIVNVEEACRGEQGENVLSRSISLSRGEWIVRWGRIDS
jgi:hypothetical protein